MLLADPQSTTAHFLIEWRLGLSSLGSNYLSKLNPFLKVLIKETRVLRKLENAFPCLNNAHLLNSGFLFEDHLVSKLIIFQE